MTKEKYGRRRSDKILIAVAIALIIHILVTIPVIIWNSATVVNSLDNLKNQVEQVTIQQHERDKIQEPYQHQQYMFLIQYLPVQ